MDIKISVIVYVKNCEKYIEQCVRSVMGQSLREIEIIVADGGSNDATVEIIEKLRNEDERIQVVSCPPSVGKQFNMALKIARGEYIGICEADDYICSNMYEEQYKIAKQNDLDMVRANYMQFLGKGEEVSKFNVKTCYRAELYNKVLDLSTCGSPLIQELGVNGFWTGIYKKEFLLSNNIFMNETPGAAHQDITFSYLTQMSAKRVWYMDSMFYCYRLDNPNASAYSERIFEQHEREYELLEEELKRRDVWQRENIMFFNWKLGSIRWIVNSTPITHRDMAIEKSFAILEGDLSRERYSGNDIFDVYRGYYEALIKGKEQYRSYICGLCEEKDRLMGFFNNIEQLDDKVVLFGVGNIGDLIVDYFIRNSNKFVLADNDKSKQEEEYRGYKVYSAAEVCNEYHDNLFIIANAKHGKEISDQLINLGIVKENIYICDDEEFFLRQIYVRKEIA